MRFLIVLLFSAGKVGMAQGRPVRLGIISWSLRIGTRGFVFLELGNLPDSPECGADVKFPTKMMSPGLKDYVLHT